jgi:hypothetical protein
MSGAALRNVVMACLGLLSATAASSCQSQPAARAPSSGPGTTSAESTATPVAAAPVQESETAQVDSGAAAPDPSPEQEGREIKYVVTPEGLEVRTEGVRFTVDAEAVRAAGGWGLKLRVLTVVKDEERHSLLRPRNGPLSLAGKIQGGGRDESFSDERHGDDEQVLSPGNKVTLTRAWPGKDGGKALAEGQTLELDVGLWGLGKTAQDRRPVRSFFHVKLGIEHGKPKLAVTPPASAKQE